MKKKKSKKPSWIDIKKAVNKLDYSQLVDIVKNLYQLSEENKIMKYSDGIGWGYHDDLCHFFYEAFQS